MRLALILSGDSSETAWTVIRRSRGRRHSTWFQTLEHQHKLGTACPRARAGHGAQGRFGAGARGPWRKSGPQLAGSLARGAGSRTREEAWFLEHNRTPGADFQGCSRRTAASIFAQYKTAHVKRRIQRRMTMHKCHPSSSISNGYPRPRPRSASLSRYSDSTSRGLSRARIVQGLAEEVFPAIWKPDRGTTPFGLGAPLVPAARSRIFGGD